MEEGTAVLYAMAAIGVASVSVLLWKALRPPARAVLAPDDDPEFLRSLNREGPPSP
ncbi:MAG: hypothetical protein ACRDQH_10770 [Pseudonocardiaceae bacterium]